jgi:hypothetical protein
MSTSPDGQLVSLLSHWLARHRTDAELREGIAAIGTDGLGADQTELVEELARELVDGRSRGDLEMVARETLEALALG